MQNSYTELLIDGSSESRSDGEVKWTALIVGGFGVGCGFSVSWNPQTGVDADTTQIDAEVDAAFDAAVDEPFDGPQADVPTPSCPSSYVLMHGSSRYRHVTADQTWYQAAASCESDGAHLVVVDSASENMFVSGLGTGETWVGASDHLVEGAFRWVDGTAVGYSSWSMTPVQPNNSDGAEDCVAQRMNGTWVDERCSETKPYVCECDGVAPPTMPSWCVTGTATQCGTCAENCIQMYGATFACSSSQTCYDTD
ncbi:MAG: C-type lectin domain-containing protein [Kofleriaceae bacterium]